MSQADTHAGQAVYSKAVLSIYDFWVLGVSNHYFWKCPTRHISQLFTSFASNNHLDVGVGTGYYLKKHLSQTTRRLGLMDLNPNSLEAASRVVNFIKAETHCHDVFEPVDSAIDGFDSVSINFLLHCLPGAMSDKSVVLHNLKQLMNDGGVIFGSTILGEGVPKNCFATKLMAVYNQKGVFSNEQDNLEALREILEQHFLDVDINVIGCVALFSAKK